MVYSIHSLDFGVQHVMRDIDSDDIERVLTRAGRVVLCADVVESVRLMERNEEQTLLLWLSITDEIRDQILPRRSGWFVKDTGDGVMADFNDARDAVLAAFEMHDLCARKSIDLPPEQKIFLRIGVDSGNVVINNEVLHGRPTYRSKRLASLALPGRTVVSARVRDALVDAIDADIEDLGECWLRHMSSPVRAYSVAPPGTRTSMVRTQPISDLRPGVAVMPFATIACDEKDVWLGDVIADGVTHMLSRIPELKVISQMSARALAGRGLTAIEIGDLAKAEYLIDGRCSTADGRLNIDARLCDARSDDVIWSEFIVDDIQSLLDPEQALVRRIAHAASLAIVSKELRRARNRPIANLRNYTLLLAAVASMHRFSRPDFEVARRMLEALIDRGTRQVEPQAWLANWHVLKVIQGWSHNVEEDTSAARAHSAYALDADPENARALAIDGFVHMHLHKRFDIAADRYDQAIASNPNESLAWLLRGTMYAFTDRGADAITNTELAGTLAPFDLHRFFTDSLRASAHLTAGDYETALRLAEQSRRANRYHASTLRVMAVAQQETGRTDEARKTIAELLQLEPGLTVSKYLKRAPSAEFQVGKRIAKALAAAGLPK